MEIRSSQAPLRTVQDLLEHHDRRAHERQRAISEGIEQYVRVEKAKSELTIRLVTTPAGSFEAKA